MNPRYQQAAHRDLVNKQKQRDGEIREYRAACDGAQEVVGTTKESLAQLDLEVEQAVAEYESVERCVSRWTYFMCPSLSLSSHSLQPEGVGCKWAAYIHHN